MHVMNLVPMVNGITNFLSVITKTYQRKNVSLLSIMTKKNSKSLSKQNFLDILYNCKKKTERIPVFVF